MTQAEFNACHNYLTTRTPISSYYTNKTYQNLPGAKKVGDRWSLPASSAYMYFKKEFESVLFKRGITSVEQLLSRCTGDENRNYFIK